MKFNRKKFVWKERTGFPLKNNPKHPPVRRIKITQNYKIFIHPCIPMPSSEKIKVTSSQLTDVLEQLETQLLPLNPSKVKLLKTLQKIVLANIETVDDEKQLLLNEKMALRSSLLMKLASVRREIPKSVTQDIENNWSETFKKVKDLIDQRTTNIPETKDIKIVHKNNKEITHEYEDLEVHHPTHLSGENEEVISQMKSDNMTTDYTPLSKSDTINKQIISESELNGEIQEINNKDNIKNDHDEQSTEQNTSIDLPENIKLQEMTISHLKKLKDLNENIPEIVDNFRNAMKVIEDVTQNKEATPEDIALTYFCEKQ